MAGYNNYYPQTYTATPYIYNTTTPTQNWTQPITTPTGAINWVQGEAGARSVPVAPGQKALLMDSETNIFYIKSSDASGMPLPLRVFEYKEVGKVATTITSVQSDDGAQSTYVTHEELNKILSELKLKTDKTEEVVKEDKTDELSF